MIISQTIRNGLCIVNKTGSYFQLISASGIVNVTLNLAGRSVLNSKMWVGMNLDKAQPYDEIIITSEQDGAVEFWAGDVSMTQSAFVTVRGANAVRTKTVDVLGTKLLTSGDLNRQSIRLRSNKDVFIGGGGVNGSGWQLKANIAEDFPIAGSMYAYKQLPQLAINKTEILNNYPAPTGQETTDLRVGEFHVSANGQTILAGDQSFLSNFLISTDFGVTWTTPAWVDDSDVHGAAYYLVQDRARSAVYLLVAQVGSTGSLKVFVSHDDGVTFSLMKYLSAFEHVGISYLNFFPSGYMVDGNLFFNCSAWWGCFNPDTYEVLGTEKYTSLTSAIKAVDASYAETKSINVKATSKDGSQFIVSYSSPNKKTLFTDDGGQTFSIAANVYLSPQIDDSGNFLAGVAFYNDYWPWFSTNGGRTFERFIDAGTLPSDDFINFIDDKWLQVGSNTLKLFYLVGDEYKYDSATVTGLIKKSGGIATESGDIVTAKGSGATGAEMQRLKVSSGGDLSPAKVEIMEMLN